jgi:hypothetical protein
VVIADIEFRWVQRIDPRITYADGTVDGDSIKVLQFRRAKISFRITLPFFEYRKAVWTDWQDVPVVEDERCAKG